MNYYSKICIFIFSLIFSFLSFISKGQTQEIPLIENIQKQLKVIETQVNRKATCTNLNSCNAVLFDKIQLEDVGHQKIDAKSGTPSQCYFKEVAAIDRNNLENELFKNNPALFSQEPLKNGCLSKNKETEASHNLYLIEYHSSLLRIDKESEPLLADYEMSQQILQNKKNYCDNLSELVDVCKKVQSQCQPSSKADESHLEDLVNPAFQFLNSDEFTKLSDDLKKKALTTISQFYPWIELIPSSSYNDKKKYNGAALSYYAEKQDALKSQLTHMNHLKSCIRGTKVDSNCSHDYIKDMSQLSYGMDDFQKSLNNPSPALRSYIDKIQCLQKERSDIQYTDELIGSIGFEAALTALSAGGNVVRRGLLLASKIPLKNSLKSGKNLLTQARASVDGFFKSLVGSQLQSADSLNQIQKSCSKQLEKTPSKKALCEDQFKISLDLKSCLMTATLSILTNNSHPALKLLNGPADRMGREVVVHLEEKVEQIARQYPEISYAKKENLKKSILKKCQEIQDVCSESEIENRFLNVKPDNLVSMKPEFMDEEKKVGSTIKYFNDKEKKQFLIKKSQDFNHKTGKAIFVIDEKGDLYINFDPEMHVIHHSSLTSGNPVKAAGEIEFKDGQIVWISNNSGHFNPPPASLYVVKRKLQELELIPKEKQIDIFADSPPMSGIYIWKMSH